jgi:hypothetical protein
MNMRLDLLRAQGEAVGSMHGKGNIGTIRNFRGYICNGALQESIVP